MDAYDLDDTLADTRYVLAAARGLANVFQSADVLYTPRTDFMVITARPHATIEQRQATLEWLRTNQPNYKEIHYVTGATEELKAKAKAIILQGQNADSYTDNNPDILKVIRQELPDLPLFIIKNGKRTSYV